MAPHVAPKQIPSVSAKLISHSSSCFLNWLLLCCFFGGINYCCLKKKQHVKRIIMISFSYIPKKFLPRKKKWNTKNTIKNVNKHHKKIKRNETENHSTKYTKNQQTIETKNGDHFFKTILKTLFLCYIRIIIKKNVSIINPKKNIIKLIILFN